MSLDPILNASPVIQIHAACAFLALALGAAQLFRKKGDVWHRALGRSWVTLMAIVALSSFFVWTIRMWWLFSPIHLISLFTLAMLWLGVSRARRGDIASHRLTMKLTYFLALVVTGLLTFLPGRIMYRVAFGAEGATPGKLAVFAVVVTILAALALLAALWRKTRRGAEFVATH
jgi:uncharacterized membrane protein